jgi:hypothetical protein
MEVNTGDDNHIEVLVHLNGAMQKRFGRRRALFREPLLQATAREKQHRRWPTERACETLGVSSMTKVPVKTAIR